MLCKLVVAKSLDSFSGYVEVYYAKKNNYDFLEFFLPYYFAQFIWSFKYLAGRMHTELFLVISLGLLYEKVVFLKNMISF